MGRIEFDGVRKVYDDEEVAVAGLDLDVGDGEFLTLVGPSGSGKSTVLRLLAGLEDPTAGEIRIDGAIVDRLPPRQRDVAMVFQDFALYPHKTVRGNLAFGLQRSTSLSVGEIAGRIEETAELLGIEALMANTPDQLSGGQQQRVALGRAIVRDPEVFLFDEPLSNLDAKLRKHMRTELNRIQGELGTTTIYVTHDQEDALSMGDRVAVLEDGELQQVGTPGEVYRSPSNLFVAGFVGSPSVNRFPGRLVRAGDGHGFVGAVDVPVPADVAESITAGRPVPAECVLAIRPVHLTLAESDDAADLRGTVERVESMGQNKHLHFSLPTDPSAGEYVVLVDYDVEPAVGSEVGLRFSWEDAMLFDAHSGRKLRLDAGTARARSTSSR